MDTLFSMLALLSIVGLIIGLVKPSVLSNIIKKEVTRKQAVLVFSGALILFFILLGITSESVQEVKKTVKEAQENQEIPQAKDTDREIEAVDYEIIKKEDHSMKALGDKMLSEYKSQEIENLPTAKRMSYRVLVSSDIKEGQVRPTVEKIVSDLSSKDNKIDSIHLLLYSDKEIVDGSYDVAMATWAPGGKLGNITPEIVKSKDRTGYEISLSIRDNLEEYLKSRAEQEDKHGLSQTERHQIFKEIIAAEDKAFKEADKLYPLEIQGNFDKNMDKTFELQEKYKLQINEKYNITDEIRSEIVLEGVIKRWPE